MDMASWHSRLIWYVLSICLLVYVFSAKGYLGVSDTAFSFRTAQAIVSRGQLDIPYAEDYTLKGRDGRSYSKYGVGLPLYFIPFVVAGNALSRVTGRPADDLTGFLISFANIPFAMVGLLAFAKLLRLFGVAEVHSSLLVLALGLATLVWAYTASDFSEAMQMGLLMLAVYGVIRATTRAIIVGGAAFAWLFLVKLVYITFFPILAVYLFTRLRELRGRLQGTALFTFPLVLACGLDFWLNVVRFGNPLESGYGGEAGLFFPAQLFRTIPILLGSFDKGLFLYSPILILGIFGWPSFFRKYRPEAILCGALIIINLVITGAWHSPEGGARGPRLLVPLIPLWLLPSAFLLQPWQPRKHLWAFASVALASSLLQVPGVLVKNQEIDHIKQNMLDAKERAAAPSDYTSAFIILEHKLTSQNEVYRLSDFHIPGDRKLDLTPYRTFLGLNLWTEHVARQLNKPALRWFPVLGLLVIAYLAFRFGVMMKAEIGKSAGDPVRVV